VMGLMALTRLRDSMDEEYSRGESTAGCGWQPIFHRSLRKDKKYSVYSPSGKLISFGSISKDGVPAGQFKDRALGLYSDYDHNDIQTRDAYRARHSKIKLKDGGPAYLSMEQPAYYSWMYLW